MNKEDVVRKETGIVCKYGVKNSDGRILVPIEYDFVEQVNDKLYVATKGSINGLRYTTGRITCTVESGGTYGVVFNRMLENKTLDTEVEIYTNQQKLHLGRKIKAVFVCKNDDMLLILDENYKWSMILIDYQNQVVLAGAYTCVDSIKMDYDNNRFIVGFNDQYVVVSFKEDNTIDESTPILLCEPMYLYEKGVVVKLNDKYGFMTYSGQVILSSMYDDICPETDYINAINNDGIEVYTYSGEFIIGGDYISIESVYLDGQQLFLVEGKENKFGLYSSKNKLLSVNYSEIVIGGCDNQIVVLKNRRRVLPWLYYDGEKDKLYVKIRARHQITQVYVDEAGYNNL